MNKDAEQYHGKENIEKAQKEIEGQFGLSASKAYEVAVKALDALDAHGGSAKDWGLVKKTIDVVVKGWVEDDEIKKGF